MKKFKLTLSYAICIFGSNAQTYRAGLKVNDTATEFIGKDQNGKSVSVSDELKTNGVVLIFYRGQWCPYCNKELKSIEDSLSLISLKGETVLAITPEKPDNVTKTIDKTRAAYSIISDDGLKIMNACDVAYSVDPDMAATYKSYGIDFMQANGGNGANLPVTAVYIINKTGNFVYRYFDIDYRNRARVKDIIDHP
jgi:peroxiredoxin